MSAFKYLVCLDFEATCWEERNFGNSEIIEFGAVLLRLDSGKIESSFHDYVRPIGSLILRQYCINLTGIKQDFIDRQDSFPIVYQRFINWLGMICTNFQLIFATAYKKTISYANTTFCTWTKWDLSEFFRQDIERHGITPPICLKAWIDARTVFEKKFIGPRSAEQRSTEPRVTFSQALKFANIQQAVNAHSAIADATDLSKLVHFLYIRSACLNTITDWRICPFNISIQNQ